MSIKKIDPELLVSRPFIAPSRYYRWIGRVVTFEPVQKFRAQHQLEMACIQGQKASVSDIRLPMLETVRNELSVYAQLLNQESPVIDISDHESSGFTDIVQGRQTLEQRIESDGLVNNWHRSKNDSRRSFNQLNQDNIDVSVVAARKALDAVSYSSRHFWHFSVVDRIENVDNIYHILTHTHLMPRQTKRLKYYEFINSQFKQLDHCLMFATLFYSDWEESIVFNARQRLINRCLDTLIKDTQNLSLDAVDLNTLTTISNQWDEHLGN